MRNMQSIKKRALAFFLSLAMCMSLLSTAVFAAEAGGTTGTEDSPAVSDTQTSDETTNEAGTVGSEAASDEGDTNASGGEAASTEDEGDAEEDEAPVYICGKEEHTHSEDCYELRPVYELICGSEDETHEHSDECYGDPLLECKFEGEEGHVHTEECTNAELICQLDEAEGHIHTGDCYTLICEQETGGHSHTEECYTVTGGKLICEQEEGEEHIHSEACYAEGTTELTCGQEEAEGHVHEEACYELTCELEETEGHAHGEDCYQVTYICGMDEAHEHTEECYKTEKVLVCEVEEHVHSEECVKVEKVGFFNLAAPIPVSSYTELEEAVKQAEGNPATIEITDSFDLDGYLWIDSNQNITLTAKEGVVLGRSEAATGSLCVNGNLTLENILIDGRNVQSDFAFVYNSGTVTMNANSVVQNCSSNYGGGIDNHGTFVLNGGTITGNTAHDGGGVYNSGTFTIKSGDITGNIARSSGGGVFNSTGSLIMEGGAISSNNAYGWGGGVFNDRIFDMKAGTIINNTAGYNGGGVHNREYATFTLSGGTIGENTTNDGSGVYNNGTFTLSNGKITSNTCYYNGSGVYNDFNGTFTMDGGSISENKNTGWYGGGVYNQGTFELTAGKIENNTVNYSGGGIYNINAFTASGGAISGNTASSTGGGVYSTIGIEMSNTEISGNENGGIVVHANNNYDEQKDHFTLNNLKVTGNKGNNAALYISSISSWDITDCTITDNTIDVGSTVEFYSMISTTQDETAASRTLTNCNISNNTASTALKVNCVDGTTHVTSCTISKNEVVNGAVYSGGNDNTTLGQGTRIVENTSSYVGGVYNSRASNVDYGSLVIDGAVITGNSGEKIGGVYTSGYRFDFRSGAIYANEGKDFYAAYKDTPYSLIKASDMVDEGISFTGFAWIGAPAGQETEALENAGAVTLVAETSQERFYAKIGETKYTTLNDALEAAQPNDIVEFILGEDGYSDRLEIREPIAINKAATIKMNDQKLFAKGKELFQIGANGSLTLLGKAMLDGVVTIKEGGSLTMDGSIRPYVFNDGFVDQRELKIEVQNGTFTINGTVATDWYNNSLSVTLGKDQFITAGDNFNIASTINITLDDETFNTLNSASSETKIDDVVLIKGCGNEKLLPGIRLSKSFAQSFVTTKIAGNDIVLHKEVMDGIFLNPQSGNDGNNGLSSAPVLTFDKAKEIAAAQKTDVIYLMGEISASGELNGMLTDGKKITLKRYPVYKGHLIKATSSLSLTNITLDGAADLNVNDSKSLIHVSGGSVTLGPGVMLQNNDISKQPERFGQYGGGVYVSSGSLIMNEGAAIEKCKAQYGGGVAIITNAGSMTMNGGTIRNNTAVQSGGGISMPLAYQGRNAGSELTILGGTIDSNNAGKTGGGIFVQSSNTATIGSETISGSKVYITNNTAAANYGAFAGGGIYVNGGNEGYENGFAQFYRVVVKDNNAASGGSGLAGCATSTTYIHLTNGGAFYDNGNDDILTDSVAHSGGPAMWWDAAKIQISPLMLGNSAYNWKIYDSEKGIPLSQLSTSYIHCYSDPTEVARENAESEANVFITGNTSGSRGGGIGSNGDVTIGTAPEPGTTTSISVTKKWEDKGHEEQRPESVEVRILRSIEGGEMEEYGTVWLYQSENWTVTVKDLPGTDNNGNPYTYTVKEIIDGYTGIVTNDGNNSFTITNYPSTSLQVNKKWVHNGNTNVPSSVTVQLYQSESAEGEKVPFGQPVTLDDSNDWAYTWEELDARFKWTTGEINVPEGYTSVTTTNEDGTVVTITNTYRRPVTPPPERPGPTPDPDPNPDPDPSPDPDPEEPTYEVPDEPTPLTEIPDTPPPLSELPQEDLLDIFDEDVPLAGGIGSGNNDAVWYLLALFSLAGLELLNLLEKKLFRK